MPPAEYQLLACGLELTYKDLKPITQGYYFAKPLPSEATGALLAENPRWPANHPGVRTSVEGRGRRQRGRPGGRYEEPADRHDGQEPTLRSGRHGGSLPVGARRKDAGNILEPCSFPKLTWFA